MNVNYRFFFNSLPNKSKLPKSSFLFFLSSSSSFSLFSLFFWAFCCRFFLTLSGAFLLRAKSCWRYRESGGKPREKKYTRVTTLGLYNTRVTTLGLYTSRPKRKKSVTVEGK